MAQALQEEDLRAYLQQHPTVSCSVQVPQGAPCEQAVLDVGLPPFEGSRTTLRDSGPHGCALIEQRSGGAQTVPEAQRETSELPFDPNQATANSETDAAIERLAARMKADPRIECVALSGQNAVGEEFALADQRARTVKRLLIERGIEATRVTVFSPTVPTYAGTSVQERQALDKDRTVRATVVVYRAE